MFYWMIGKFILLNVVDDNQEILHNPKYRSGMCRYNKIFVTHPRKGLNSLTYQTFLEIGQWFFSDGY